MGKNYVDGSSTEGNSEEESLEDDDSGDNGGHFAVDGMHSMPKVGSKKNWLNL